MVLGFDIETIQHLCVSSVMYIHTICKPQKSGDNHIIVGQYDPGLSVSTILRAGMWQNHGYSIVIGLFVSRLALNRFFLTVGNDCCYLGNPPLQFILDYLGKLMMLCSGA